MCVGVVFATLCGAAASAPVDATKGSTDLLWLIAAGGLVFFMQAGYALLHGGMGRAKNAVSAVMANCGNLCVGAVAFWLLGFGLMFGSNASGWLGTDRFLLHGLLEADYGRLFFHTMVVVTAATIVSGAIAERTKFGAALLGSVFVTGFVVPVLGAWAWGSWGSGKGWLREMGFIDLAGSTVVHSVGGWAALAALLVVGPRLGRFAADGSARPIPGHNLPAVALGGFVLWLGWFGFNGGALGAAGTGLGRIVINTHIAGAGGAIGAVVVLASLRQPMRLTAVVMGAIAGLVAISAGCGVMTPLFAALTGLIGGALSVWAVRWLERVGIDDVVGAVPVHLVGGVWGTIAAGLFRQGALFDLKQFGVQVFGCAVAFVWAFGCAWAVYSTIARTIGLRASTLEEQRGLDFSEHGEIGYPLFERDIVHAGKR